MEILTGPVVVSGLFQTFPILAGLEGCPQNGRCLLQERMLPTEPQLFKQCSKAHAGCCVDNGLHRARLKPRRTVRGLWQ